MEMLRSVFSVYVLLVSVVVFLVIDTDGRFIDVSSNSTARNKAEEHFQQIEKRVCKTPVAKLFPVDDVHTIHDGYYKPHCVELHRCNNDAGCCKDDTLVCAPIKDEIKMVHLHISKWTVELSKIEVFLMPFENHTKCECQLLSEVAEDWR